MTSLRDFAKQYDARVKPTTKGRVARPDRYKSDLERRYATHLQLLQLAGEVAAWRYEAIKLRLADGAWYTPDFMVEFPDGRLECHETKGFMREAARVRLRVAAEQFPCFRFLVVRAAGKGFEVEEVA